MPTAGRSAEAGDVFRADGKARADRLGAVRLGDAAVLHPRRHLPVRPLFRQRLHGRSGAGLRAVGLRHRHCRADRRRACARARRHRRREPEPQALDRLLLRAAGGRAVRLVACGARPHRPRNPRAARLRPRHHRRRACHRLHQRHDGVARLRQEARHAVGLRLGDRLCRRLDQPGAGRGPPRRRSA